MIHAGLNWMNMGGYAGYIWFGYSAVFIVFIGLFLHAKCQKKRIFKQLKDWGKSL